MKEETRKDSVVSSPQQYLRNNFLFPQKKGYCEEEKRIVILLKGQVSLDREADKLAC
jgi:hypothetical protein